MPQDQDLPQGARNSQPDPKEAIDAKGRPCKVYQNGNFRITEYFYDGNGVLIPPKLSSEPAEDGPIEPFVVGE